MDKNTIAGLVIIFLILIGFSYLTRPSKEQVAEMQRKQDSIARVDRLRAQELAAQQQAQKTPDNTTAANPLATKSDSIFVQNDTENKIITLENDKIKLHISTLGGRIVYVPGHDNHPVLDRRTLPAGGYVWNQEDDDTYNVRRLDGKWVIEQRGKVLYKQADK